MTLHSQFSNDKRNFFQASFNLQTLQVLLENSKASKSPTALKHFPQLYFRLKFAK